MPWPVHPNGLLGAQGDNDAYKVERSLRFNSGDLAYLNRTAGTPTNSKKWTWSGWVKRSKLGTYQGIFDGYINGSNWTTLHFWNDDRILFYNIVGGVDTSVDTVAVFRDCSAWYHVVFVFDSDNATVADRAIIYVNGTRQMVTNTFGTITSGEQTYWNLSGYAQSLGRRTDAGYYLDAYLTEINFIDGQALTPSSFGETDAITGRWKAKAYSGTYGTNGFYLKFADNSSTAALGTDSSGNGNTWTTNNFSVTSGAGNDSLVDSPTNYGSDAGAGGTLRGNYATLNPLDKVLSPTIINGNLDATVGDNAESRGAIYVSSGKWYWEIKPTTMTFSMIGISIGGTSKHWGTTGVSYYGFNGDKYVNGSSSSYGASYTSNDVIGVALNLDNLQITFYKNNISQGTITGLTATSYCPAVSAAGNSSVYECNFGQRPFAYTAPTGFKALCTTNLTTPTIKKPSSYMDVVTYTGNGVTNSITGLGFSPDMVWLKGRSLAAHHRIYDTIRGVTKVIYPSLTDAEVTVPDANDNFVSFDSGGFTLGSTSGANGLNQNSETFVAWAWDEAPIAGMDIVSYTGTGANRTIAHNLGVAPKMMIIKNRASASDGWAIYHSVIGAGKFLVFSTNSETSSVNIWNNTAPTASVFSVGIADDTNRNNGLFIAYLFAEIEGFSKFGSYTGNGSADGPFVYCGFRPRWVMIKQSSTSGNNWQIIDAARSNFNFADKVLFPNTAGAETTANATIDIVSSGFKIRTADGTVNTSSATYIFAAFAEAPFKYARAR